MLDGSPGESWGSWGGRGEVQPGKGRAWGVLAGTYLGLTLTLSFHCGPLFRALPPLGALEPSYTGDDTGEPAVHGGLSEACQPPSPQASSGAFLSPQLSSEVAADAGVQTELLLCSPPPPAPCLGQL